LAKAKPARRLVTRIPAVVVVAMIAELTNERPA